MFRWLLALACITSLNSFAQSHSSREHINFDENWRFAYGNASDPAKDFNFRIANIFSKTGAAQHTAIDPKFNDSSWRSLELPHDWVVELPFVNSANADVMGHGYKPVGGLFPETSVGWYRKHFTVSKKDSGQRFQIQFDGVYRDAMVWVNGFYLDNHKSGYTGVEYDVTDYINYDKDNVIAMRVDASQYEGWFYEGAGIYRHVWLNKYARTHIVTNGVFVYTKVGSNTADVSVEVTVENEGTQSTTLQLVSILKDRSGKRVGTTSAPTITLDANEKRTIKQKVSVVNPKLWSLDDPYLYRVTTSLRTNGKSIDEETLRIGIRTITVSNKGLFLNGKYVKVQGTNNHQDHAGVGSALPDYLQYYRISLLKQMGCNAYRTSHHPPTPELLDACDSLGMLVLDENRLLNSSPQYMEDLEWLIKRDRSRACVFMWSIGNEEGWVQTTNTGMAIATTLLNKQRTLDPTRVSTYAADVPNVFKGINEVITVRGFNYREFAVADYHRDHPQQPVLGTEMGSTVTTRGIYKTDSVKKYLPDQDITAPWWASTAEAWWKLCAPNDWWMGGFIWTGFDYRGEPTPFEWPNISSHFGVMDVCGFPKNIYYYYQSWWTDKDVLHISPHWNWKGKEGQPQDVWVNSNADNVELYLNGKSLGKKDMPRNGHLQWKVNYEPGTLEAVAFKKGKKITAKVETTGTPVEVIVTPYKTTMLADGKDATVINISVVDKEGREVPDANNLIRFSVKGDAKIIGVGNGDPSSHEQDKYEDTAAQRYLFNGHCQVIVQPGKHPDFIRFSARSEGLWNGGTEIITINTEKGVSVLATHQPYPIAKTMSKPVDKMLGADISFLPELESKGIKFKENGKEEDVFTILKRHGFNYIRLRVFNEPARNSGYSPGKGFCDLEHTKQMAKRIKAAGMKFLLDFHYSDYWADPGKQYKPYEWRGESMEELKRSVYDFTKKVMTELKGQGTLPDMVQIGNEINHGMIWPTAKIDSLDNLAQLIYAGINGVKFVEPSTTIMLHIALGGQNNESRFFVDNMLARQVPFDVIGLSYYPKWHGTLQDLQFNVNDLAKRYNKDVIVVEYTQLKKEVNDIAFDVVNGKGKGTCIWEPLNTWEAFFDKDGNANEYLPVYDEISRQYLKK